jgi:hypothetical protein
MPEKKFKEMGINTPPKEFLGLPVLVHGPCNPPYLLVVEKSMATEEHPVIFDEIF